MQIRKICEGDIARCVEIYNYYIENTGITFEESLLTAEQFSKRVEKIAAKYPYLVAVEGEKVLGYGYLCMFGERSAYRYTAELSLYLDKNCLNSGIGGKMLAELENGAAKLGIKSIVSVITSENENSLRFHEKHDYVFRGKLEKAGYKFGRWLDVSFYQKFITE